MRTPPRSVRAVRPSVAMRDATLLDDFFRREFDALHRLNDATAQHPGGDANEHRSTTAKLARQYQTKLDDLCTQFADRARRPSTTNEPTRIQRVVVLGESGPHEAAKDNNPGVAHAAPRGRSGLVVVSVAPGAMNADATGALPLMRSTPQRAETASRPKPEVTMPATGKPATAERAMSPSDTASSHSLPPLPLVRKAAVPPRRAVAAAGGPDRRLLWGIVPLAIVLAAIAAFASYRARPVATAADPAQRTHCFAPYSGVRVIARGGSLTGEVTVCAVSSAAAAGGFTGEGSLAPEVSRAMPTFECVGGPSRLDVSVVRTSANGIATSSFRCRARSSTP